MNPPATGLRKPAKRPTDIMRIGYYAPFKPLDHPNPSGDLVIARGLAAFLQAQGHHVRSASRLRARWIYWKPYLWPWLLRDILVARRRALARPIDLWLTYHCYYKAPDLLGPMVCRSIGLPYVIFQGVYATKYRRRVKTWPGFRLNQWALRSASHIFTNKQVDLLNLRRLVPGDRVTYIPPGIRPREFVFDSRSRETLRREWGVGDQPVILAAAMFRPDVKTEGLLWLIRACAELRRRGHDFTLVIAGDGREREAIRHLAGQVLKGRYRLIGRIPRQRMAEVYSAGDIFAFPGIGESLGMVYLEAQACGLPVVAFDNGGIPEVVDNDTTGYLTPLKAQAPFVQALERLIARLDLRREMGRAAVDHVGRRHDLDINYARVVDILARVVEQHLSRKGDRS